MSAKSVTLGQSCVDQAPEIAAQRELNDDDFCRLCGVCLPADERCTSPNFEGSICPHAEAAAAQANL